MKKSLVILALTLAPSLALAIPALVFDTTPGGAGGTLTYDGVGGAAVGTDIVFVEIAGWTRLRTAGWCSPCVDVLAGLHDRGQHSEGPQWSWAGGGTFTLTGDVPLLGLDDAILLAGTFVATANTPGLAGADPNGALHRDRY